METGLPMPATSLPLALMIQALYTVRLQAPCGSRSQVETAATIKGNTIVPSSLLGRSFLSERRDPYIRTGCALAFADSNDIDTVMPEDMVIFSVNQQCITSREVNFSIPISMPACSQKDFCLCAWFWEGQNSDNE
jgi:hypothetical protein